MITMIATIATKGDVNLKKKEKMITTDSSNKN